MTIITREVSISNELSEFLKKKELLEEFVEESKTNNNWGGTDSIVITGVSGGFEWRRSKRGQAFWMGIHNEYQLRRREGKS